MKYNYYIVDIGDGSVKGTNSDEVASDFSYSDDHFVINAEKCNWLVNGSELDIKNINAVEDSNGEEPETDEDL